MNTIPYRPCDRKSEKTENSQISVTRFLGFKRPLVRKWHEKSQNPENPGNPENLGNPKKPKNMENENNLQKYGKQVILENWKIRIIWKKWKSRI